MKKFKLTSSANGKVFRSGVYSTAILAAAIVLAVLLNLLVGALPKKYTEFDLSEAKMYTLGDSSKKLVQSLDQDVTVYYLCETGSEDAILTKLLDHYADESSHFRWEQKDPAIYPTFAAQYGASDVSTGSLIVVSGENNVVLDAADLYEYDYSDYYTTGSANVTFGGEKQITSAIYKLTAAEETHAYYTTNHGEQALTSSLTEALEAQNITAQPLDLLTSTIPDDCDLLIINDPTSDFASDGLVDEISQLQTYLENGGRVLLTTNGYDETPNLDAVMAQFGLAREAGLVVEGDSSHALYGYPYSLFPDYGTTDESTALDGVNRSTHVMLSVAQGITVTETDGVTAESLLNTSEDAYSKLNFDTSSTTAKEDGDTDGPFSLAVWARNETTGAEVIWIGCPNMDNEQLYQSIPGNLTFLQGCAASMVGQDILIDTKALEASPITISASTATTLGLVFVFVLPAAVLIAGAVVVLLRRRK
jgi:ABC-2 type transport system permease protein